MKCGDYMSDKILEVSKIVILVMIVTMLFFPITKWIANHVGALDLPNKRKVHKKPMPLMGGLMMFFGFLFGYMVFAPQNTQMLAILIGAIAIFLLNEDLSLGWYKLVAVALGYFIFRLFLFVKNLQVFFKRIEY